MKTIEELKEMTQDELIAMVQNLEEKLKKEKDAWFDMYNQREKATAKFANLRDTLKGIVSMTE
jgi:hypothetical protein